MYMKSCVSQRHHAEDLYFSQKLDFLGIISLNTSFPPSAYSLTHGIPQMWNRASVGEDVERSQSLKVCNGSFHLEDFLEESKTVVMENRLVAARGWGEKGYNCKMR